MNARSKLLLGLALVATGMTAPAVAKKEKDQPAPASQGSSAEPDNPYPSTYKPYPGVATAIRGATIFDGEGGRIDKGVVFLSGGKITSIGMLEKVRTSPATDTVSLVGSHVVRTCL